MRQERVPALTGIRFFAALAVLGVHFGRWLPPPGPLHTLVGRGGAAVGLFFTLSGFILAHTYGMPDGSLRGTPRAFYRARIARIYPVYLLALVLALLVPDPFYGEGLHADALLPTLTLTQAWVPSISNVLNGPGWSLSAEAFFYALFPLLLPACLRLSNRQRVGLIAALWVGSAAVQTDAGSTLAELPIARLPEFLTGMLAYGLWAGSGHGWGRWQCDLAAVAAIGAALLSLAYAPAAWSPVLLTGGLAPLWTVLLCALATGRGYVARALGHPLPVLLGAASYSLYILHWPLWCLLATVVPVPVLLHTACFFWAYVVLAVLCSVLAYRYVEEPARHALRATARPPALPGRPTAMPDRLPPAPLRAP